MPAPRFLVRGLSKDPDEFRKGERFLTEWWVNNRQWIPMNAWIAVAAAVAVAIVFVAKGPLKDPAAFYGIAAQVIPAFLVALAVERSLLDSLGTKADHARRRRDEALDTYDSSGLDQGIVFRIELALMKRVSVAIEERRLDTANIPVSRTDVAKASLTARPDDDALTWRLLRARLHEEVGLPLDDPDPFEEPDVFVDPSAGFAALDKSVLSQEPGETIRWLAVLAAVRHQADVSRGMVEGPTILTELKRLHAVEEERKRNSFLKRVTYCANLDYDRQHRRRTISLRFSILLLVITELATMVGVMSPHQPYRALFIVTVCLAAASVVNVAGGALAELQSRTEHAGVE
jgi:hypothetical protein